MLEAKLWRNKTETNNVKVAKMVEFIKICDQYPRRFNFGNFLNVIILFPHSAGEKKIFRKRCLEGMGNSFCLGGNGKNLGRILLGSMSKNEQIQFFDSQMYLPVILAL